jgi:hypothetical protein
MRAQGTEGEEGESSASTRVRRNVSSAVHYWNAAATISYLRDALLSSSCPLASLLAEEGGGVNITIASTLIERAHQSWYQVPYKCTLISASGLAGLIIFIISTAAASAYSSSSSSAAAVAAASALHADTLNIFTAARRLPSRQRR